MSSVSTMIPALLTEDADRAAGTSSNTSNTPTMNIAPLSQRMQATHYKLAELKEELDDTSISVSQVFEQSNALYALTHQCAIYPVQNIAARRQIDLPSLNSSSSSEAAGADKQLSETVKRLNAMLQENSTHVDRLEGMPSVYLWRTMEDLQKRIEGLYQKLAVMKKELDGRRNLVWREVERVSGSGSGAGGGDMDATEEVSLAMQNQMHALVRVAGVVGKLNEKMDELRQAYKRQIAKERFQKGGMSSGNPQMNMNMGMNMKMGMGGIDVGSGTDVGIGMDRGAGFDPFLEADRRENEEERRLNMEVRKRTIQASTNIQMMNAPAPPVNTLAPAPVAGGLFGGTPAPALAGGGLFGSTPAPAPAGSAFGGFGSPAPVGGGLFGGTPAAAPAGGGLFGSTPAPAPAGGGLFGGTPAPAPAGGGLFGSSTPTAPAGGNFSFGGSTPAPATGGGLFGGTPAPAPAPAAGGFAFGGAATPAPAAGGLFGAPAAAAPAPSTSKTRRRAGRRR